MKICEILLFGFEKSRVVRFDPPPVQKWGMNRPCNKGLIYDKMALTPRVFEISRDNFFYFLV